MSEGPAHQARVGLGSSHSRSASERAWSQPSPGAQAAATAVCAAAAAAREPRSCCSWPQCSGSPCRASREVSPAAGTRVTRGLASGSVRGPRDKAPWRRADLLRAARGWDTGGGGPLAPEDGGCSRSLRLRSPLAPRTGEAGVGGGGPPLSSFRGTLSSSSAVDG